MTNVRRPIQLQLRPAPISMTPTSCHSPKALSPTSEMPTEIMPHLFLGNQEQTNRETINRLNIKYILSLGLLPIISAPASSPGAQQQQPGQPTTPNHLILMPSQNSSRDFKIRLRTNTPANLNQPSNGNTTSAASTPTPTSPNVTVTQPHHNHHHHHPHHHHHHNHQRLRPRRDENMGVKAVRSIHCKCINIADNSDQSLIKFFDEAHAFIDEARRKKCNILVHCLAGISRSPTFAIAYLMRVRSLHWKDAYDLVKQSRPQIDPNLNFMGQLRIYNKSLRSIEAEDDKQRSSLNFETVPTEF